MVLVVASALAMTLKVTGGQPGGTFLTAVSKNGQDLELRSEAKILADEVLSGQVTFSPDEPTTQNTSSGTGEQALVGPNVQVNDPALDNIQIFPGFRPFLHFTQSETTVAASGQNVVVSYNNSAGLKVALNSKRAAVFTQILLSGYSFSTDGGHAFTSAFVPPAPGVGPVTFGDGVVVVDRHGNFYYASLGAGIGPDSKAHGAVVVNKSTDGGKTFGPGVVAAIDDGSDKNWIAVGPDPEVPDRDNVYVTWTTFSSTGSAVSFAVSKDGGQTFQATIGLFAPGPDHDQKKPQNFIQFTNPVVDPANGRLYIPFAQFSNSNVDFLRMLVSNDAGQSFHFVDFHIPTAPGPTLVPLVQPGTLEDCGRPGGGLRLAIVQGNDIGGGRFGLPRFVQSSRLTIQPALAALNGNLSVAYNASDSPIFGDPASGSNIFLISSSDGGNTWTRRRQVNPSVAGEPRHVYPAITAEGFGKQVDVSYYTQHADGRVDLDLVGTGEDSDSALGNSLRITNQSFNLTPSNIPIPTLTQPFRTQNFDRNIVPCYDLGEYVGLFNNNGSIFAVWGGNPNLVTEPTNPLDPISGQTHAQADDFFQIVKPMN
jgi:hypothetical protein